MVYFVSNGVGPLELLHATYASRKRLRPFRLLGWLHGVGALLWVLDAAERLGVSAQTNSVRLLGGWG